jgi:hypothetical protein
VEGEDLTVILPDELVDVEGAFDAVMAEQKAADEAMMGQAYDAIGAPSRAQEGGAAPEVDAGAPATPMSLGPDGKPKPSVVDGYSDEAQAAPEAATLADWLYEEGADAEIPIEDEEPTVDPSAVSAAGEVLGHESSADMQDEAATPMDGASAQDEAYNGAQVAAMIDLVKAIRAGEVGKRAATSILMLAFKLTKAAAADMLADEVEGSHPPPTPAPFGAGPPGAGGGKPPFGGKGAGGKPPASGDDTNAPPFGGKVGSGASAKPPSPEE